jgi:hypothetical protein
MEAAAMDWNQIFQWSVTFLVAAGGWWVGHHFSSRRDLVNERRKRIVTYLLEAYRKLERASNRDNLKRYWPGLKSAIADIQLLGSARQVSLARQFSITMAKENTAPLDELIFDLRQSLRSELHLAPVDDSVIYLRIAERLQSQ